jgi:hypothetical protein
VKEVTPQLSVAMGGVHVTGPEQEEDAVKLAGTPLITGAMLSDTVTVEVQVAVFPPISVTVKVTVLMPRLPQSNAVLDNKRVEIAQLSVDPLLTSLTANVADPEAFR